MKHACLLEGELSLLKDVQIFSDGY